jgi:WD40 repeat protein
MNLSYRLPAAIIGTTIATLITPQIIVALSPADVNAIAKQIMIRIDGANTGTGVIVDRQGNTYTVLTNWHVVKEAGTYTIQTADGKTYQVNSDRIKQLPQVDLAELTFTSDRTYRVAQLGNSDKIPEGTTVYAAGWIAPDRTCSERCDRYPSGQLIGRLPTAKDGYSWVYSNVIKPGMSGGPVLDEEGRLVGINGQAIPDARTQQTDFFAIPINTYSQLAARTPNNVPATPARTTLPSSPPANVTEPPRRTPATTPQPTATPATDNIAYDSGSNFSLFKTLTGHSYLVWSVAISSDGQTLASGSGDKTIKVRDISSGKLRRTLIGHSSGVWSVAISPDGRTLASGSSDKTIKIWDISSGKLRRTLTGHSHSVVSVAISPDGRTLASGSYDKTIKIWRLAGR